MTQLQLALDEPDLDVAVARGRELIDLVEIIEVGTPLVIEYGMEAVRRIREACPGVEILADLKVMDAGRLEASLAFRAGADWVSVLGVADDATVHGVLEAAADVGGHVLVDLIGCTDISDRGSQLAALGAEVLCVHTAFDVQASGADPLTELAELLEVVPPEQAAVAGGIRPETLPAVQEFQPRIVVVGGYLAGHSQPRKAAAEIRKLLLVEERVS
ncbi:MAG: 3-hexulose-6-phosphate synthase [Planctomycetaceae bacterium]